MRPKCRVMQKNPFYLQSFQFTSMTVCLSHVQSLSCDRAGWAVRPLGPSRSAAVTLSCLLELRGLGGAEVPFRLCQCPVPEESTPSQSPDLLQWALCRPGSLTGRRARKWLQLSLGDGRDGS